MQLFWCEVFIQPIEEDAVPQDAILWFGDPVSFFGEIEEPAWDPLQLGSIEGFHSLGDRDAEVLFAMDHEQRSFPIASETVW